MAPIYPVHKHDLETGAYLDANGKATTDPGEYIYDYEGTRLSNNGRDAIAETEFNQRELVRVNQTGHTYLTLTPVEGLNLTANYSINNIDYRRKVYENPYVGDGTAGPGRLNQMSTRTLTQTFNQLITYSKSIGNHNFDVLLGHENYSYKYEYLYGMKTQETVSGMYEFGNFVNISSLSIRTPIKRKVTLAVSIMIMRINTTLHFLIAMMVPRVLQKRTDGGISGRSEQAGELVKRHL